MSEKTLIERTITKAQSKYEIVSKHITQQGSYNLDLEVENILLNNDVIHSLDANHYLLNSEYRIKLKKNIIDLIGEEYNSVDLSLKFIHTNANDGTTKFQIKRADNKEGNTSWFKELYDANCEGFKFVMSLDKEEKILSFDICLTKDIQYESDDTPEFETNDSDDSQYHSNSSDTVNIYENTSYSLATIQKIFYGVPGTGKSKSVTDIINNIYSDYSTSGSPFVFRLVIHPEYSYYDFIGNIMPCIKKENDVDIISYDFIAGPFTLALKKALNKINCEKPVFLILEEMSRGNIASVFGDLFQLLDRKNGVSEYGIHNDLISKYVFGSTGYEIKLPNNLNILGTLNTSDQNVFVMDNAFKRRFDFEYISTQPDSEKNIYSFTLDDKLIEWNRFYTSFNEYVVETMRLSEDKQIGQFYINFSENITDDEKYNKFCDKMLNYIWSDIHRNIYETKSIIDPKFKSFQVALACLRDHENIFSIDFFESL